MSPHDSTSTDRFSFIDRDSLTPEGQQVWDKRCKQLKAPGVGGHFNVMMRSPKLCDRISELEGYFRVDSSIGNADREFITLVVARKAGARYAWARHEKRAIEFGAPAEVVELLRREAPLPEIPSEYRLMVEFARALTCAKEELPQDLFDRMVAAKGERWTIDAVALVGHYSLVAVTIHGYGVRTYPEIDGHTF